MSLIRTILRLSTVQVLRERTWAGARVFDSDNTPLPDMLQADQPPAPFLTVFTDIDTRTNIQGRDAFIADRACRVIIEMGLASAVSVPVNPEDPDAGQQIQIRIPARDAGMEIAVDVLELQVMNLLFGSPDNPWSELWRSIVLSVDRVPSTRGASADRSRRWSARQLIVHCDVISDLPFGTTVPANHALTRFIALATTTGGAISDAASIIDKVYNRDAMPEWKQIQAVLGMTRGEAIAAGLQNTGVQLDEVDLPDTADEGVVVDPDLPVSPPTYIPYDLPDTDA